MIKVAKEHNYGKINDVKIYAVQDDLGYLKWVPRQAVSSYYPQQLWAIYFDSGAYPSISNVEDYICGQVTRELKLAIF